MSRMQARKTEYSSRASGGGSGQPGMEDTREQQAPQPYVKTEKKIGRNDPCPCGSGKKYKNCHGA